MKLFLISQTQNNDYESCDAAVVAAPDSETAKYMDPETGKRIEDWTKQHFSWCNGPLYVTVSFLGEAAEGIKQGVVCASFNAG